MREHLIGFFCTSEIHSFTLKFYQMKFAIVLTCVLLATACTTTPQQDQAGPPTPVAVSVRPAAGKNLFIDVHKLEPGKVTFEDVKAAHLKDLATQGAYGVSFIKFWVDEAAGEVYCLSEAPNAKAIQDTHGKAHGLLPDEIHAVKEGE